MRAAIDDDDISAYFDGYDMKLGGWISSKWQDTRGKTFLGAYTRAIRFMPLALNAIAIVCIILVAMGMESLRPHGSGIYHYIYWDPILRGLYIILYSWSSSFLLLLFPVKRSLKILTICSVILQFYLSLVWGQWTGNKG